MKYSITIDGYLDVEVSTRDLAIFIARQIKAKHPEKEVKVYKDVEMITNIEITGEVE